jgi:hypothetical protein
MSTEALFENTTRHLNAIDLCIKNKLRMPALILVYSGIDILAALNRPEGKEEGTRKDFKDWCEKYMLSNQQLPCSSSDLYSARCGVVHSYSSQSRLTRNKEAKEIVYSWGNQSPEPLKDILNSIDYPAHVLHVETLVDVFKAAVNDFLEEVGKDNSRIKLVLERAAKLFKDQPKDYWR